MPSHESKAHSSDSAEAIKTTDHDEIRRWVEERNGVPAAVSATHTDEDAGILRIDFDDGEPDEGLEPISWEQFFEKFEERKLAFLHQDRTQDGSTSRFFKLIRRD